MHDTNSTGDNTKETPAQIEMTKIYLKDLSFESPNSPHVFENPTTPEIGMRVNVTSNEHARDMYEIILRVTLTATINDATVFLIELDQAAIFLIRGYTDAQRKSLFATTCASSIFPFAREAIWTIIGKGGFPGLLIRPVDFNELMSSAEDQLGSSQA